MYRMDPHQIKEITDYIFLEDSLAKADLIFIPGCARPDHTEEAARLYREGWAPVLVPSGGFTKLEGGFRGVKKGGDRYGRDYSCEADFLEAVLLANGVPASAILKEREATYTLENAEKSRELLLAAETGTDEEKEASNVYYFDNHTLTMVEDLTQIGRGYNLKKTPEGSGLNGKHTGILKAVVNIQLLQMILFV